MLSMPQWSVMCVCVCVKMHGYAHVYANTYFLMEDKMRSVTDRLVHVYVCMHAYVCIHAYVHTHTFFMGDTCIPR